MPHPSVLAETVLVGPGFRFWGRARPWVRPARIGPAGVGPARAVAVWVRGRLVQACAGVRRAAGVRAAWVGPAWVGPSGSGLAGVRAAGVRVGPGPSGYLGSTGWPARTAATRWMPG